MAATSYPPPPEKSFLPEFAYRAENTPAAHIRTPVSTTTETTPPPRNGKLIIAMKYSYALSNGHQQ